MSTTMSKPEQTEFLKGLGLNPDAPALEPLIEAEPAKAEKPKKKKAKKEKAKKVEPVQPDVDLHTVPIKDDLHTVPIKDIVFDPALVEEFKLDSGDYKAASDKIFKMYKGPKGSERNPLLHRKISEFLGQTKRARKEEQGGGYVKDKMQMANLLVEHNITAEELQALIESKK